jgi:hypothetical protein
MAHDEGMASEPPPEYVAFVARHLDGLRLNAARVMGCDRDADLLYPQVLADVAAHWAWLERRRKLLRDSTAADLYLDRAFARQRERQSQPDSQEIIVDIQVWTDEVMRLPLNTTNAVRIASLGPEPPQHQVSPECEASIAWFHAYEDRRRRTTIVIAVLAVFLFAFLNSVAP